MLSLAKAEMLFLLETKIGLDSPGLKMESSLELEEEQLAEQLETGWLFTSCTVAEVGLRTAEWLLVGISPKGELPEVKPGIKKYILYL